VDDLRANVRVSLDFVNDCRLATGDQERLPDAMLLLAHWPANRCWLRPANLHFREVAWIRIA
jgi:hypothetical protein